MDQNIEIKRSVGRPRKDPISKEEKRKLNREYHMERNLKHYHCECGSITKISNKYRHMRTKRHLQTIELINALKQLSNK